MNHKSNEKNCLSLYNLVTILIHYSLQLIMQQLYIPCVQEQSIKQAGTKHQTTQVDTAY